MRREEILKELTSKFLKKLNFDQLIEEVYQAGRDCMWQEMMDLKTAMQQKKEQLDKEGLKNI